MAKFIFTLCGATECFQEVLLSALVQGRTISEFGGAILAKIAPTKSFFTLRGATEYLQEVLLSALVQGRTISEFGGAILAKIAPTNFFISNFAYRQHLWSFIRHYFLHEEVLEMCAKAFQSFDEVVSDNTKRDS